MKQEIFLKFIRKVHKIYILVCFMQQRKVLLSRDNKLPKDVTNSNVVIDKIEYRKIDGVKRHLGKYTGQLEKRDVDGEIRITYKNGDSKTSVFKD